MSTGLPRAGRRYATRILVGLVIAAALLSAACTTTGDNAGEAAGVLRITGVVVAIDTDPWAYDGNAIVQVETADQRRLQVQLPARWNLCQAGQVDVDALATGMRVEVLGAATGKDSVVVCGDAAHHLVPIDAR